MAVLYNGEIVSNRALKQKIKKDTKQSAKEIKAKAELLRKDIWFIGPKPGYELYEGRIVAELEDHYNVEVKARRLEGIKRFKIAKTKIKFEKE